MGSLWKGYPDFYEMLDKHEIGYFCQYNVVAPEEGWIWAIDNLRFSHSGKKWNEKRWLFSLESRAKFSNCLFATVPDVLCDHQNTLKEWNKWNKIVKRFGYKTAFVLQNGATEDTIPWHELDALFIGGDTEYKMSDQSFYFAGVARSMGKHVHVGRINTPSRYNAWKDHADSCDGTFIVRNPTENIKKLKAMISKN